MQEDKAADLIEAATKEAKASAPKDLAKENADLTSENAALKAEVARLRNVAFSLEVTCKTLASMMQVPSLLGS